MKSLFSLAFVAILFSSCTEGQTNGTIIHLSATEFAEKIGELPNAPILDVRTPYEYSKGHLARSLNFDVNGIEFEKQIAQLDKSKPVFVYCLSGGRSTAAAGKMHSVGFDQVYEMDGGILKWRGANLPEVTNGSVESAGMTRQQFDMLLNSDKIVLIDFYAEWCAPCRKMKPYLDEIAKDMTDTVLVIRINTDDNQALCKELKIDALPVLHLYKNNTLIWNNTGFIEKAEVLKKLRQT